MSNNQEEIKKLYNEVEEFFNDWNSKENEDLIEFLSSIKDRIYKLNGYLNCDDYLRRLSANNSWKTATRLQLFDDVHNLKIRLENKIKK